MVGMTVNDTTIGTTIGNLGFTEMKFPKPVFHGDTLRARTKVLAMRESRSRPDVGIVEFEHTCWNQRDEMVAICKRQAMMRKLPKPNEQAAGRQAGQAAAKPDRPAREAAALRANLLKRKDQARQRGGSNETSRPRTRPR